jgi:hypothetical protein
MRQICQPTLRILPRLAVLALAAGGCVEAGKSSNILSPTVAGPLPGVAITAPQLVSPPNGRVLSAGEHVVLAFGNVSSNSPRPFWYEVQVSTSGDFSTLVSQGNNIQPTAGQVTYTLTGLAADRSYYWRVRANDGANASPYATAMFEVITPVQLGVPGLVSPIGGTTTANAGVTFTISNAPVVTGSSNNPIVYRIEVATDNGFSAVATSFLIPQGSPTSTGSAQLSPNTQYFWRAQAIAETRAGNMEGPWSSAATFRTGAAPASGGGTSGGGGSTGGGGNGSDQINPHDVTYLHRNIANWAVISTITNISIGDGICFHHTGAGQFPQSAFGDPGQEIAVEGNVWVFAPIGGRWYGATWDWLRPGQVCKGETLPALGVDQIRIAPMDHTWNPPSGSPICFAVSARARDSVFAGEVRTNIACTTVP